MRRVELSMVAIMLLLFLLIAEFSVSTAQQNVCQIRLGSSLISDSNINFWLSESKQFAFGFYKQRNGSLSVGIWFANTKQKTIVWRAKWDAPPLPGNNTLLLDHSGRLVLQDARGEETMIANTTQPAASASMLDSGNFVLCSSNSSFLWQSFDSPTDTLLPTQRLVAGNKLVSAVSETDWSRRRFQLIMQRDGNLVQYPIIDTTLSPYHAYWDTQTHGKGDNLSLNLDPNGWLYLLNSTSFIINNLTVKEDRGHLGMNVAYRLTLDVDGILRLYGLVQDSSWKVRWVPTTNKCDPTGFCGLNSYCSLIDQEPYCLCLPGFDFIDQNQRSLGCRRHSSFDVCTSKIDNRTVSLEKVSGVMWEDNLYSVVSTSYLADCEEECLRDCECEIALFMNEQCKKQKFPMTLSKVAKEGSVTTIIKVQAMERKRRTGQVGMGVLISGVAMSSLGLLGFVVSIALIYRFRMWQYRRIANQNHEEFLDDVTLRPYTFMELEKVTNGFTDQLGKGAFGTVFKGVIVTKSCRKSVAVKKLERVIADGEREFRNEMKVIGKTHHRNLVKLLGYCHEGTNRLQVYEYMENGSLADFLFRSETKPIWEERIRIALNIARGILYLHEDCETQIIHCDIKPENILLDEQNCAKIADFGLAKLLMPDQTRTYTGLRGTRGYVAPEWHSNMPITVKADVYSFGIVLLEIVCGRRSVDMDVPEDKVVLANWVFDCFLDGELDKLVDNEEDVEKDELMRMIKLGLWCIQEEPSLRPSMKKVCLMLEGTIEIPAPPNPTSSISVIQID